MSRAHPYVLAVYMRLAKLWGDPATRPRVEDYGKSYYEVLGVGRQVP